MKLHRASFNELLFMRLYRDKYINPFDDGSFRGCSRLCEQKVPFHKVCHSYPPLIKLGTVIPYIKKIQKTYRSRETLSYFWWKNPPEISNFCYIISNSFNFFQSLKVDLIKMVAILTISAKLATRSLPKVKIFWNKCYDVKVSVHDVNNKILSRDSDYIVDVVMWPKFGNSSISMK